MTKDGAPGFCGSVNLSHGMLVPIQIRIRGGSTPTLRADDPSYRGLSAEMISLPATDVDDVDEEYGTITMTLRDTADASPSIRLASGTSISVSGGWVTSGYVMPVMCVMDTSSSARPSPVRSAMDVTIHVTDSSVCTVVAADAAVVAVRPAAAANASSTDRLLRLLCCGRCHLCGW
jgi:hypothetical protein